MPWQIEAVVAEMKAALGHPLGIHAHNDGECAVANSIAAVRGGARHVQGTINGYGERCGNANLCAIIPNLELKLGLRALPDGALRGITELSHYVAEVANLSPDDHMAYVGRSAFAHKGGVHVAAMRREPASYQHIDPALVGNAMRTVVSELSGRGNLLSKAEEFGLDVPTGAEVEVLEQIEEREARGSSFEAAEASVALLLRRSSPGYKPPFRLLDFKVIAGQREGVGTFAEAMIKIAVDDEVVITAAEGSGPVNALDGALRKALAPVFPAVRDIQLVDYKVRILDGRDGTSATTRVLINSRDAHCEWSTVGASTNIIDASWHALADGIEYGLTLASERSRSSSHPRCLPARSHEGQYRSFARRRHRRRSGRRNPRHLDAVAAQFGHSFSYSEHLIGGCAIDATGTALTQETLDACRAADAVLLGAVGGPEVGQPERERPPRAGAAGPRARARPVRQPAADPPVPGAHPGLSPQGGAARGRRHPGRP